MPTGERAKELSFRLWAEGKSAAEDGRKSAATSPRSESVCNNASSNGIAVGKRSGIPSRRQSRPVGSRRRYGTEEARTAPQPPSHMDPGPGEKVRQGGAMPKNNHSAARFSSGARQGHKRGEWSFMGRCLCRGQDLRGGSFALHCQWMHRHSELVEDQLNPLTDQLGRQESRLNDTNAKLQNLRLEQRLVLDSHGPTFAFGSGALTENAKREIDGFFQDLEGSPNSESASGRIFVVAALPTASALRIITTSSDSGEPRGSPDTSLARKALTRRKFEWSPTERANRLPTTARRAGGEATAASKFSSTKRRSLLGAERPRLLLIRAAGSSSKWSGGSPFARPSR